MRGRRRPPSAIGWVVLLGGLIAGGMVVHDLLTHPLALPARVEAHRNGQRVLLVGTSLLHAPAVVGTFPTRARCEAHRHEALRQAQAAAQPLPSLACLGTLPTWAGALVSSLPTRERAPGAFVRRGMLARHP